MFLQNTCTLSLSTKRTLNLNFVTSILSIWLHFPNIFDSNDHKANIKLISFKISGLFFHEQAIYIKCIMCSCTSFVLFSTVCTFDFLQALKNQAVRFRHNNIPIHGIGVQSHFYTTEIDMDVTKVDNAYECRKCL